VARALNLVWSPRAVRQLDAALEYLDSHAAAGVAARTLSRIDAALSRLLDHPFAGRPGRLIGTRELSVGQTSYVIVYRVTAADLEIAALLHMSRKSPRRL